LRLLIAFLPALLTIGCGGQKEDAGQGAAAAAPIASQGKLDRSKAGQAAPDVVFTDPDGEQVTLAQFQGKPLLLNLWATWCAPCVAEMPALDTLAGAHPHVQVLAVSQDIAGQEAKVSNFFEERKLSRLEPYRDPEMGLMMALKADVLPTTILYDVEGREVWRMTGADDWAGSEAASLLAEAR